MTLLNSAGRAAGVAAVAAMVALGGCESDGSPSTAGVSSALGGLGAFAACRGLTSASNGTCLAVGAAGALVGYGVGKHLQDKRDREAREAAIERAAAQKAATPVRWDNTKTKGARGSVTLTRTYTNADKRQCKAGNETARLPNGQTYSEKITLCYNPRTSRYEPV